MGKRQRTSVVSSSTSISSAPTSSSSGSLFDGPSSKSSSTAYVPSNSSHNSTSYTHTELLSTSITPTSTFNAPWTYTATQTSTGTAAAETSYVPGVIFNLTFAGDSDSQAVYSVPMSFGHGSQNKAEAVFTSKKDKRRTSSDWNGGDAQTVYLQIDLGSSDLVRTFLTSGTTANKRAVGRVR
jgi:hypothetical protein